MQLRRSAAANPKRDLPMNDSVGVIVNSTQIFDDSLPLATVGNQRFLEFLLRRVSAAFPARQRIFAMAFWDLQRIREDFAQHVESLGFTFFIADRDDGNRLARTARHFGLEHVLDVDVLAPLSSMHFAEEMIAAHLEQGADLTLCHNLPRNLAPWVVSTRALGRYTSLATMGFCNHWGIEQAAPEGAHYTQVMLANPQRFNVHLYEAPVKWQGAGWDAFSEQLASLRLADQASLPRLRECVYTLNKDDITSDDVIDFVLIENMQKTWSKAAEFDSKFAVVDHAGMETESGFDDMSFRETRWFVLNDKTFLADVELEKAHILELGCGHGRLIAVLADRFGEVHGTDVTRERIMEARYRLRDKPNVFISQNDGRSLQQYPNDRFDLVYSHGVLVHIHSRSIIENYIQEMARVVKPGGRIKFDIYHGSDTFGIGPRFFTLGSRYTEEEIEKIFIRNGLGVESITYAMHRQYHRQAGEGAEYSLLPLKQMLVVGIKQ